MLVNLGYTRGLAYGFSVAEAGLLATADGGDEADNDHAKLYIRLTLSTCRPA